MGQPCVAGSARSLTHVKVRSLAMLAGAFV
jgi:hypothetical protein